MKYILAILLVIAVDNLFVLAGTQIGEKRDIETEIAQIDWTDQGLQKCSRSRFFLFYRYQHCTYVIARGPTTEWRAAIYFHRPRAIFSPTRLFMTSQYYFGELPYGRVVATAWYSEADK